MVKSAEREGSCNHHWTGTTKAKKSSVCLSALLPGSNFAFEPTVRNHVCDNRTTNSEFSETKPILPRAMHVSERTIPLARRDGLSTGSKAGIGISVAVIGLFLAAVTFLLWRRRAAFKAAQKYQDVEHGCPRCSHLPAVTSPEATVPGADGRISAKGKQPLTAEQILGIDKRSLLENLPIHERGEPQYLRVTPASLGNNQNLRSGPGSAYVNPWDVEYRPNPVLFSHLNGSPSGLSDATTVVPSLLKSPVTQTTSPNPPVCEMDVQEATVRRGSHQSVCMINGVPHSWDIASRSNRMNSKSYSYPFGEDPLNAQILTRYHAQRCKRKAKVTAEGSQMALKGKSRISPTSHTMDQISASSSRIPGRFEGPYPAPIHELDALEAEIQCISVPQLGNIPHGWEPTLGSNNMFFDADPKRYPWPSGYQSDPNDWAYEQESWNSEEFDNLYQPGISQVQPQRSCTTSSDSISAFGSSKSVSPINLTHKALPLEIQPMAHKKAPLSLYTTCSSHDISYKRSETSTCHQCSSKMPMTISPFESQTCVLKRQRRSQPGQAEENILKVSHANLVDELPCRQTQSPEKFGSIVSTPTSMKASPCTEAMDFEYDSGSSLVLTSSRASAVSSISIATASTSGTTSTASTCALKFACPDCNLKFRTAGLRRNHHNRKHNLRYTCVVCTVPFGLRADLERHEHTVHSDLFRSERRFWCTVPGCAIPKKEFNRKDNFDRHVERCRRTAAKGKGPAWTPT